MAEKYYFKYVFLAIWGIQDKTSLRFQHAIVRLQQTLTWMLKGSILIQ